MMKTLKIILAIIITGTLFSSCNSPMEVDSPQVMTPVGQIPANVIYSNFDINNRDLYYYLDKQDIVVDLSQDPPVMWINRLKFITNDLDSANSSRLNVENIDIRMKKAPINGTKILLSNEEGDGARYKLIRCTDHEYDVEVTEAFGENITEISMSLDKSRQEIEMVLYSKIIDDCYIRTLVKGFTQDSIPYEKYETQNFKDSLFVESKITLSY